MIETYVSYLMKKVTLSFLCFSVIILSFYSCGFLRQVSGDNRISNFSSSGEIHFDDRGQTAKSDFENSTNIAQRKDIINLPDMLYVSTERAFAGYLGYDFSMDKAIALDIIVNTELAG